MKKVFVIAGASTGIGYSLSVMLLKKGHKVIGISRSIESTDLIENEGFIPISADLTEFEEILKVEAKIATILTSCGEEIFSLVNCVGDGLHKSFYDLSEEDFTNSLRINLFPSIFLTQRLLKFIRKPYGTICNISSIAGIKPFANWSMYCASKYALEGFMASIREELRDEKMRVINVRPGSVDTPSYAHLSKQAKIDFIDPVSVANLITNILLLENNATVEDVFINNTVGDL